MKKVPISFAALSLLLAAAWIVQSASVKIDPKNLLTGQSAFVDYRNMKAGTFRKITTADLPAPFATSPAGNGPSVVSRPADAWPKAPAGFKVDLYVTGLDEPREIRTAPNGDFFVAESREGEIKIFRGLKEGKLEQVSTFATGFEAAVRDRILPFWPNPQWVYVGNTNSVVRFPYKNGDLKATASAEVLVPDLRREAAIGRAIWRSRWTENDVVGSDRDRTSTIRIRMRANFIARTFWNLRPTENS